MEGIIKVIADNLDNIKEVILNFFTSKGDITLIKNIFEAIKALIGLVS